MDFHYNLVIIGADPGSIYSSCALTRRDPARRVAVSEGRHTLAHQRCPIGGEKINYCIRCKSCSIINGFGDMGAFSERKYNFTSDFGGTRYVIDDSSGITHSLPHTSASGVHAARRITDAF